MVCSSQGHDRAGFGRGPGDRFGADRANGCHVQHPRGPPLASSNSAAAIARSVRTPFGDQGDVGAVTQQIGLAGDEHVVSGQQLGHADTAEAQQDGAIMRGGRSCGGGGLDAVGWRNHRNVGQCPDPGEILDRVMRRTQFALDHARRNAAEPHVGTGRGGFGPILLEGTAGQERGHSTNEGDLAAI